MNIIILLALLLKVLADVDISSPPSGRRYTADNGRVTIPVEWEDSAPDEDDQFSLTKAETYSILLCTGSASYPIECFDTLVDAEEYTEGSDDFSQNVRIDADACDDGFYFLQIYVTFGASKATTHYTNRFELRDMTGSTRTLTVANTFENGSPPDQTDGADTAVPSSLFSITYTRQTGRTKYAPMQMQPGSSVTASTWSRKHATSAITTYYSALRPSPNCYSTITPGRSYTYTSLHNWAAVAPTPSVRYNPRERVTPASLSQAAKRKRWLDE